MDVLLQKRPNKAAAALFFRRLLNQHCRSPRRLVTDKLRSYAAAHREMMLNKLHDTSQYANNRIELSREPTRQREHPEPDRTRKTRNLQAKVGDSCNIRASRPNTLADSRGRIRSALPVS